MIEGLLSLVHLDHAAHLLAPLPAVASRIDRYRNGFGGHRYRGRSRGAGLGHRRRRRRHGAGHARGAVRDPWPHRSGRTDRSACAPVVRCRTTPPTLRAAAAATSPSPRRSTCGRSRWCPVTTTRSTPTAAAALLAGLESPIVHGMWLSAAAQHVDDRHRRHGHAAGPAGRLDRPLPGHGAARRRGRLPGRPRRNRPGRRGCRGRPPASARIW